MSKLSPGPKVRAQNVRVLQYSIKPQGRRRRLRRRLGRRSEQLFPLNFGRHGASRYGLCESVRCRSSRVSQLFDEGREANQIATRPAAERPAKCIMERARDSRRSRQGSAPPASGPPLTAATCRLGTRIPVRAITRITSPARIPGGTPWPQWRARLGTPIQAQIAE
jgi:hypothetical protein